MKINVLSPKIYNRISAGEVVERPASIVKELVENSLDAGATKIKVEIYEGGIKEIVVSDNGSGIEKDDLSLAFLPHATSKIQDVDDLDNIMTLGFRGEALASIASVCMVKLSTKTENSETGYLIEASGGEIGKVQEVARVKGTTISCANLFYNTPARAKFLKKPKTEEGEITHLIEKFMLSRPEISFEYFVDDKCVYNNSSGKLEDVIYLIYGREMYDNMLKVNLAVEGVEVDGYISSPKLSRPNRSWQTLFVNNRYVENYQVSACIQGAYSSLLMKGRFPIYVLNLKIPYDKVDVNVHPNKKEVKFEENSKVFMAIRKAVEKALVDTNLIADFEFTNTEEKDWSKFAIQNDDEPLRTSFNATQKTNIEPISRDEGASYKIKIDLDDDTLITPKDLQKKGIEIINMPEFSNIKSDERKKNKPGGYIFFDQKEERLLRKNDINPIKQDEYKVKIKKEVEDKSVIKQDLLVPYEFNLMPQDAEKFSFSLNNLNDIGFDVTYDGHIFKVKSVPFVLSNINLKNFVDEVIGDETIGDKKASAFINEKLCQHACKHAIRAGDVVTKEEIAYLIEEMKKSVLLCPHGRPIIVKITRKELEKMFKRVL